MLMNDYIDFSASQSMGDELRVFMHDHLWVTENCLIIEHKKKDHILRSIFVFFSLSVGLIQKTFKYY